MSKDYKGKYFSVLGDSISTLDGYTRPDDSSYYEGMKRIETGVLLPEDTWWGQVIDRLGGRLLVNNSISGSLVSKHPECMFPSYGCSEERTSDLCEGEIMPDVIMVFLGTNDWGWGLEVEDSYGEGKDLSIFSVAYDRMLDLLSAKYPSAEIWCFTLAVSICTRKESFVFPYCFGKKHIALYCDAIRRSCAKHGCRLIDLYSFGTMHDTIDGFHPVLEGMKRISDAVISCLGEDDG